MAYIFKTNTRYTNLINECINELNALHIDISDSILFKTNTGFSRFGFCKKTPKGVTKYVIAINKWFIEDIAIKETIMHELVHTVDGCYNHGKKFHDLAYLISETYNSNISVIGNYKLDERAYKNKGSKRRVFEADNFDPKTMVMMYCPSCKRQFAIKKNAIKINMRWVCKKCNKRLLYL